MADKKDFKKDDKKSAPSGNFFEEILFFALIAFLVMALITRAIGFFKPVDTGGGVTIPYYEVVTGGPNGWLANTLHFINDAVAVYVTVATIFSIIVFLAILYVSWLTYQLKVEDRKKDKMVQVAEELPSMQSQKWQQVVTHVNSLNPAEWRLSILEADVMLDDMVQLHGFHGETLGDRLKNAPKGDFKTIDVAWEAHKTRNAIAHEGSDFLLSQHESKRIIGLYETVFKEFSYIK